MIWYGYRGFGNGARSSISATMVSGPRKFQASHGLKGQNNFRIISTSIFKCSPILSIKPYQFSKFTKASIRKEKKTFIQQSMRKAKLKNVGFCFITCCFIKPFKIIIDQSILFLQAHSQSNFCFSISGFSKGETGNSKQLGMAN